MHQLSFDFGDTPRGPGPVRAECTKCLTTGRWRHGMCGKCRRDERTNRLRAYRRRPEVRALTQTQDPK